jgi:hypothetical protein
MTYLTLVKEKEVIIMSQEFDSSFELAWLLKESLLGGADVHS